MRPHRTPVPSASASRRGSSLVEVCVTLAVASVVLALGIGTLHLLLQSEHVLTDSLKDSQTVSLMSRAFRADVHAARSAEIQAKADDPNPAPASLTFILAAEHRVVYSTDDHSLLRTETNSGQTVRQSRFRFPKRTRVEFSRSEDERAAVALIVKRPGPGKARRLPESLPVPLRELRIQAVLGRDHRFTSTSEPSRNEAVQ